MYCKVARRPCGCSLRHCRIKRTSSVLSSNVLTPSASTPTKCGATPGAVSNGCGMAATIASPVRRSTAGTDAGVAAGGVPGLRRGLGRARASSTPDNSSVPGGVVCSTGAARLSRAGSLALAGAEVGCSAGPRRSARFGGRPAVVRAALSARACSTPGSADSASRRGAGGSAASTTAGSAAGDPPPLARRRAARGAARP